MSNSKAALRKYSEAYRYPAQDGFRGAVDGFFAPDAQINVVHPFNELAGPDGYFDGFLSALLGAFEGLCRTDYIAFGRQTDDGDWVTCTGYYTGHFARPWLGIAPSGAMAHLRFGEFHRMENGLAVESYICRPMADCRQPGTRSRFYRLPARSCHAGRIELEHQRSGPKRIVLPACHRHAAETRNQR
jgi:SnoaL-like domain